MRFYVFVLFILFAACTAEIHTPEDTPLPDPPAAPVPTPPAPPAPPVTVYVPVPTPVPVPAPPLVIAPTEVDLVLQEENSYREATGQSLLAPGLVCTLYDLSPNPAPVGPPTWYRPSLYPTSFPSSAATFTHKGVYNQPDMNSSTGINVLPPAIRAIHTQWYALRCTGYIAITFTDYYRFDLSSDDASLLYLDNVKVVDNDGNHGTQLRSGMRLLRKGVHSIRLDYMSGPGGGQSLILKMNDTILPASGLFH